MKQTELKKRMDRLMLFFRDEYVCPSNDSECAEVYTKLKNILLRGIF